MKIQLGLAGRTLALGALVALTGAQAAVAQGGGSETSLFGISLLRSSYRDVLKKYGRPDEIQAGGPYMPTQGIPVATAGGGSMMGSGGPSSGNKSISKNGFPGRGGTGAASPGGGGMMGPAGGAASPYGGKGGLPGFAGPQNGGAAFGMPGENPYPGMTGGSGGPGGGGPMGGAGASSGGAASEAGQPEYEATWWYHDMKSGLHKSFLFNKDGRVIQVQEYGHDKDHKGSKTRRGIGLGSGLNAVLHDYGWSNDGVNDGKNLIMRFGGEDKIAFQLVNNVVVGITIAIVKDVPTSEAQ